MSFKYSSILSTRSPTVIFSSSLSSRNFSTFTKVCFFSSFWGDQLSSFYGRQLICKQRQLQANVSCRQTISQALIVSDHSSFPSKQIFNIVSLDSIVVALNASPKFSFGGTKETIGLKEETLFSFAVLQRL